MVAFNHEYGSGQVGPAHGGGSVLVVAAHINLDRSAKDYDEGRLMRLKADAEAFAKEHDIAHVELAQGAIHSSQP